MRHHDHNRKFGRVKNQRVALLRSLAVSLIMHEAIETTEAKAKELRPYVERLVTKAKPQTLAARRLVTARLGSRGGAAKKMVDVLADRYQKRAGGYIRITKLPRRLSDGSPMARISFVA